MEQLLKFKFKLMMHIQDFQYFQSGDRQAFKKIFDTFYKALFLFAQKYIKEIDAAEDLVQEVFVKLWEKRETIDDLSTLKSFLYVSVRNQAFNHLRHRKLIDQHKEEVKYKILGESFFKNHLIEEETHRLLLQAISELPLQSQRVCTMSMNGVKNAVIAEELKISISTVKYHKNQILSTLRDRLKDHLYLLPLFIILLDL